MNEAMLCDTAYRIIVKERFLAGREVFETLNREKIPYAVHKGAVLSQMLYGNPWARKSGDVDLLFSRENAARIKDIFKSAGFTQGRVVDDHIEPYSRAEQIFQASQTHQLAPFVKATGHKLCPFVEYDCNMDIFWGEAGIMTDMNDFLQNTSETGMFGVTLRKLTPEAELIALCMHHYKDCNSIYLLWTRGMRSEKIGEISRYVQNVPMKLETLSELCARYHVGDYVCCCVHLACVLQQDERLKAIERRLMTPEAEELFDSFGLRANERKQWNIPFGARIDRDLKESLTPLLDDKDRKKIRLNLEMM